jgi:hypothetical protein
LLSSEEKMGKKIQGRGTFFANCKTLIKILEKSKIFYIKNFGNLKYIIFYQKYNKWHLK